jgi:O-antigen/teichoic acid export membrane protein
MLPRMSALYAEGNIKEFKKLISKSTQLLFSFAIPAVIYTVIFAPEIVYLISGAGYEGAYLPARIIMPLILIIGYEQVLVIQILMPTKQDKAILTNSILKKLF